MKFKNLFLIGLFFTSSLINAQSDFRAGYILKNLTDTLFGEIDYRGDILMSTKCRFRDSNENFTEYLPNDLFGFGFSDSKYYVSNEVKFKNVFLECLVKGKVNIYYMRDENGNHYFIENDELGLTELPFEEGTKYVDNVAKADAKKRVFFKSTKHIGLLKLYMQDAPKLKFQIENLKKPEHQNLVKLAEDYHKTIGEKCIVYDKKLPVISIHPEIVGGIINFSDVENLNDKSYFHSGIIGHIWLPRANERFYIRTGILISKLELEGEMKNIYKIPLQVEYISPKGSFRPRIAYGINYYYKQYETVSLTLGTNVKLSETLFLSATSDIEFNPSLVILPKDFLSYSLKLGLFMRLK